MRQQRPMVWAALLLPLLMPPAWASASDTLGACFVGDADVPPVTVSLEVADTPAERRKGLMGRTGLRPKHGMLFIYPSVNDPDRGFWMKNTLIPLDIAYVGPSGTIVGIQTMQPCQANAPSDCPVYEAGAEFQYAVEMAAGFFSKHDIQVGHSLVWPAQSAAFCRPPGSITE